MKNHVIKKPLFIILYGPTGVGKTDFSIELAKKSERFCIINADLGQLYTPLTIGTAKPEWQSAPVPHCFFDVLDQPINFTVTDYRDRVMELMQSFWQEGKIPILVGGSGFYLHSLLFPPHTYEQTPFVDNDKVQPSLSDDAPDALWHQLAAIDYERALKIHKHDTYRLQRALAIWHTTGKKPSSFAPNYNPPADYMFVHLTRDRSELYARIDQRVEIMLNQGWIQEVSSLLGTPWEDFLCTKKLIGYDDIIRYLKSSGTMSYEELVATIAQKTRHYAKRQEAFGRMMSRSITTESSLHHGNHRAMTMSLNLTFSSIDLYINELSEQILHIV